MTGPCEWNLDYGTCDPPEAWSTLSPEERATFEEMAVEFLWRWTGRVLGICEVSVRPCRDEWCDDAARRRSTFEGKGPRTSLGSGSWGPVLIRGEWYNVGCFSCGDSCSCYPGTIAISLPGPVAHVTEVLIDGEVLDPSSYRVDSRRWLVRTDGEGWPTSQDLSAPANEPGTWQITYGRGTPVPAGGQIAAGMLAIELWRASCGDEDCGLPQRVQSITRQGVTVAVLDSFDDIDSGHTGIYLIDSWVASMTRPPRRPTIHSPDTKRGCRA